MKPAQPGQKKLLFHPLQFVRNEDAYYKIDPEDNAINKKRDGYSWMNS